MYIARGAERLSPREREDVYVEHASVQRCRESPRGCSAARLFLSSPLSLLSRVSLLLSPSFFFVAAAAADDAACLFKAGLHLPPLGVTRLFLERI